MITTCLNVQCAWYNWCFHIFFYFLYLFLSLHARLDARFDPIQITDSGCLIHHRWIWTTRIELFALLSNYCSFHKNKSARMLETLTCRLIVTGVCVTRKKTCEKSVYNVHSLLVCTSHRIASHSKSLSINSANCVMRMYLRDISLLSDE